MNTRSQHHSIQGPHSHHAPNLYNILQDQIEKQGISCSVLVANGRVSIRTETYADYIVARKAIKGMTSMEVVRDFGL